MTKYLILIFILSLYFLKCEAVWSFQEIFKKILPLSPHGFDEKNNVKKELKENCDENQLLLQLARLYATSPERVISLLCTDSVSKTCQEVSDVLERINHTLSDCKPLEPDNLYIKLNNGLDYLNSYLCRYNSNLKGNHLVRYQVCLRQLREDFLDCEGPPDWFEKSSEAIVCGFYKDIIDCYYTKTALLCGVEPAVMLRKFSDEIMRRIVKFKCKISRSLPRVDDPMPARACHNKCHINFILYMYTICQLFMHTYVYKFVLFLNVIIFNIDPLLHIFKNTFIYYLT